MPGMDTAVTLRMCRRECVFALPQLLAPGSVRLGQPEAKRGVDGECNAEVWVTGGRLGLSAILTREWI